jgi:predicted peptidase
MRRSLRLAGVPALSFLMLGGAALWQRGTAPAPPAVAPLPAGFAVRTCEGPWGDEVRYSLYVPPDRDPSRPYPLIVFLHGHGERGSDGRRHLRVGLARAIRDGLRKGQRFNFLALFPHGRTGSWAAGSEDHELVLTVLDDAMDHYAVDRRRIYLTGLSSGGTGTWQLAAAHPERWAAIVPVCGSPDAALAAAVKDIPCWCFHGTADGVAPVANLRQMLARLRAEGGRPRCTEYAGLGHGIWDKVYRSTELYDWLLRQQRK